MAIAVKDISTIAAKWQQRAAAAAADYTAGVKGTTKDWAGLTAAAADSWSQGVQAAVANGSFARGVNAAGTSKWQSGAVNKGTQRYPTGVAAAGPAYQSGFAPYLAVIASLNLTPRGPRGSPQNAQRSQAVGDALHRKKTGQ
jgi:hypothetical protein